MPDQSVISKTKAKTMLGVNYWKLAFYHRAELECRCFEAVRPLIWQILGGLKRPVAVATDILADSTLIRR